MPSPDQPVSLSIDWALARICIERFGPTAFALVVELAASASPGHGCAPVAKASMRALADRLGLGKDTVNRHLRKLITAGLIEPLHADTPFATSEYRLHLTDIGIARHRSTRAKRRPRPSPGTTQPPLPFTA